MKKVGIGLTSLQALALGVLALTASSALAVTVTPAGTFAANERTPAVLTASIGAVTCTAHSTSGSISEAGAGSASTTFTSCQDSFNVACTATVNTNPYSFTIRDGTGRFTVTTVENGTVNDNAGAGTCAVTCTIEITQTSTNPDTGLPGTFNTTPSGVTDTTPSFKIGVEASAPVTSNDTSNCNGGGLTGFETITSLGGISTLPSTNTPYPALTITTA